MENYQGQGGSTTMTQDPFSTPRDEELRRYPSRPQAQSLASAASSVRQGSDAARRRTNTEAPPNEKLDLSVAAPDAASIEKPWLQSKKRRRANLKSTWLFYAFASLGIIASALMLAFTYINARAQVNQNYCLVLDEQFEGDTLNRDVWFHEQQTGAWGTGEFEWTTDSTNNSFVRDGKLYIVPTLTSDYVGEAAIIDGYSLNLTEANTCTNDNKSDVYCAVRSNETTGVILPPVQSARINTKVSGKTIRFGKVEVTARMPTGDWIWPAVWMMPSENVYGQWPASGEIDIFEGKGNPSTKRADGLSSRGRSTLHYGPLPAFDQYAMASGYLDLLRGFWNKKFHTLGLHWTRDRLVSYYQTRATKVFSFDFPAGTNLWDRSDIPYSLENGTALENPWTEGSGVNNLRSAPFDQDFYLILSVAVGSTNGWFSEDDAPYGLPWSDNSEYAARDFWAARDKWYPTWPQNVEDRAMVIDSVKIWQEC